MVLTPALTPPLDTEVGKERLPTQLLDIEKEGETYRFGFSRLERFLAVARQAGMRYFEVGHLFTQWGPRPPRRCTPGRTGRGGGSSVGTPRRQPAPTGRFWGRCSRP